MKSVKESFPKDTRTNEINDEIDEIKKWREKIKRKDLKHEPKNYIYNFQQYERYLFILVKLAQLRLDKQSNLLKNLIKFNNKSRPKKKKIRIKKEILMKEHMLFMKVEN